MANGLVNPGAFQLVPDITRGLGAGIQQAETLRQIGLQKESQRLGGLAAGGGRQELEALAGVDPGRAQRIQQFLQTREAKDVEQITRGAIDTLALPPEQRKQFAQQRIQQLKQQGSDTSRLEQALALPDDQFEQVLQQQVNAGKQLTDLIGGGRTGGIKAFAPVETLGPGGQRGLSLPTFDPRTGKAGREQIPLGDVQLAKETAQDRREAELEAATAKERGKLIAQQRQKINTEINTNARQARRELPKLDKLLEGLAAVETGKFAQAKLLLGSFIPGIDPTNVQVAQQQINESVLGIIGRFTGAISEGERAFSERTTANLGLTPGANRIIVQNLKDSLQNAIKEEKQFKDFKKGGGKAEDFEFQPQEQAPASASSPAQTQVPAQQQPPRQLFSGALNRQVTEQDINDTLSANPGLTRDDLLQQLGVQ